MEEKISSVKETDWPILFRRQLEDLYAMRSTDFIRKVQRIEFHVNEETITHV